VLVTGLFGTRESTGESARLIIRVGGDGRMGTWTVGKPRSQLNWSVHTAAVGAARREGRLTPVRETISYDAACRQTGDRSSGRGTSRR